MYPSFYPRKNDEKDKTMLKNTYYWNYFKKECYGNDKNRCIKVHLRSQNRRALVQISLSTILKVFSIKTYYRTFTLSTYKIGACNQH